MKLVPENFDAVIFDMDGVLVNTEPFYVEVEKQNFEQLGLNISEEEHHTFKGIAINIMWKMLKVKYNLPYSVPELEEMTNSLIRPYFQSKDSIEIMPEVDQLLHFLSEKRIPMALASSSYPDVIQLILEKTGFKEYFKVVVHGQMASTSKPEPGIFLLTAEKLGVSPERCLVFEDSANGIKAAKSAGMTCIAFAGPGSELQNQSDADLIVKDFKELIH